MIRNLIIHLIVAYYNVLRFFGYQQDTSVIPKGMYCYTPIFEEGKIGYKIDMCPYYRFMDGQLNAGCTYVGHSGFDLGLCDQCKICSENKN